MVPPHLPAHRSLKRSISPDCCDEEELREIDATVERMARFMPKAPYIVSCSGPRYHLGSAHKDNWRNNTAFEPHEEDLQYLSFVWRDPATSLFVLRSEHEEEAYRQEKALKAAGGVRSGTNTPLNSQVTKKKISLSAYKNKARLLNQVNTTASQEKSVTQANNVPPLEATTSLVAVPTADEALQQPQTFPAASLRKPKAQLIAPDLAINGHTKNNVGVETAANQHQKRHIYSPTDEDSPRLAKKPRMVSPKNEHDGVESLDLAFPAREAGQLPGPEAKLDSPEKPTSQIKVDKSRSNGSRSKLPLWIPNATQRSMQSSLPPLLSSVAVSGSPNTLSSPDNFRLSTTGSESSLSSLGAQPQPNAGMNLVREIKRVEDNCTDSMPTNQRPSKNSRDDVATMINHQTTKAIQLGQMVSGSKPPLAASPTIIAVRKSNGPNSFFNNLKNYSNTTTPRIVPLQQTPEKAQRLITRLKYTKSRRKDVERILRMKPMPTRAVNAENTGIEHEPVGHLEKVTQQDDLYQRPTVRQDSQDADSANLPDTPKLNINEQTGFATSSASQKHQLLTPCKDLKPIALNLAATPQGSMGTPRVPDSAGPYTSSFQGSAGAEALSLWKGEMKKAQELGKVLKSKMKDTYDSAGKAGSEEQTQLSKLAALQGVESVLCFMQSFVAGDQCLGAENLHNWPSLPAFSRDVSYRVRNYPQLKGLSLLLGAVCCSRIAGGYARANIETETGQDRAETAKKTRANHELLTKIQANALSMLQQGAEADQLLPRSLLEEGYPLTASKSRTVPLGLITNPMVAVRMGCTFLEEWSTKEKVIWTRQLEEGLCSQL